MSATLVLVVDTTPVGVKFDHAFDGCVEELGVVKCDIGTLAAGERAEISIVVISPSVGGMITNTATASGNEFDPDRGNNTAFAQTKVIANICLPLVLKQLPW